MKYFDLDISITSEIGDHYVTRAQSQTMGESQGRLLRADLAKISADFGKLPISNIEESALKDLGQSLFSALFSGGIGALYQRALGQVIADDTAGIRIRLKIDSPEVSSLPWENLYDETNECFLATSSETPLTRYIETARPIRGLQTTLPIRILVVIPGASGLDVEHEKRTITEALADLGDAVELTVLEGKVTSTRVSRELVLKQFHILHFIGHGVFQSGKGTLVFNSEEGDGHALITAKEFSYNFQDYPSMKLVVLNSCSGATTSNDSLTGVAHELVQKGVPAVIAMREKIRDDAAKLFAAEFYLKLCRGYERGRVDIAISYARKQLIAKLGDTREFANPVLFMRSPTGVIFDLDDSKPITTVHELDTNRAVSHTIDYNIDQIKKAGGADAAAEVAHESQAKSQVHARVINFYKRIAIAAAPRVVAMALLMAVIVFFASHLRILNLISFDDYLEAGLQWSQGVSDEPLDPDVAIILGLGEFETSRRAQHAALLDGLSGGTEKPSVVAIDFIFNDKDPMHDQRFASAITNARSKGVQIVGSKYVEGNGTINPASEFNDQLKRAFGDGWGDVLVGGVRTLRWFRKGPIKLYTYEVASLPPDYDIAKEIEVVPSLALKAVMQYYYNEASPPRATYNEATGEVTLRAIDSGKPIEKQIPVTREDRSLELTLEFASENALQNSTTSYNEVYTRVSSNEAIDQLHLERLFKDKIVIIGSKTIGDTYGTLYGERVGVEFHANAISNILKSVYRPEISRITDLFIIVAMAALGVLLQTKLKSRLPGSRIKLPYFDRYFAAAPLIAALILYLGIAYLVYSQFRVKFDLSYHIAALICGYWAIAIFRKQLRLAGSRQDN